MPKATQERDRGQIIPKGDQKYLLRIYLGRDKAGKRKYHSKSFNGSKREAEKELTKMLRESDTFTYAGPTNVTLAEYLLTWVEGKTDVSERTRIDYKQRMELDIIPVIGQVKLEKVAGPMIQSAINKASTRVGARTIRYTHMILKQALERAVDWSLIPKNPCRNITIPKVVKKEMSVLTPSQAEQLIKWASKNQEDFAALWVLLLTTGMRPQEALALRWDDLSEAQDENNVSYPVFAVRRVLTRVSNGVYAIGPTKTDKSTRQVSLDEDTLRYLRQHKQRQAAQALAKGEKYERQGWVFTNEIGHHWDPSKVRKKWKAALKGAKLPAVRLYDGRHTHATLLLSAGVHLKVVADRLGHSTTTLTGDTYSHVIGSVSKNAGTVAAGAIFGGHKKQTG